MTGIYIGKPWNDEMPTRISDYRECPNCHKTRLMQITAYEDVEYWTCPACKAHSEHRPDHGRFGHGVHLAKVDKQDRTRKVADFKRNTDRKYLTSHHRRELGLEDE